MSESFEWHIFLESVEDLCQKVEHRIQLSDSNPYKNFIQTPGKTSTALMQKANRSFSGLRRRFFCF